MNVTIQTRKRIFAQGQQRSQLNNITLHKFCSGISKINSALLPYLTSLYQIHVSHSLIWQHYEWCTGSEVGAIVAYFKSLSQ